MVKESVNVELQHSGHTTEDLGDNFKSVEVALKLLSKSITKIDDKINLENLGAILHGFVNTYIANTIHTRIKQKRKKL